VGVAKSLSELEENTQAIFDRERARFATAVHFAIAVSKLSSGRKGNIPTIMASYVFTRMCITAESVGHLIERGIDKRNLVILDHYSVCVLARNILEAGLMFHYLSEDGVSDNEWNLRGKILDLHETLVKLRLFKGLGSKNEYKQFSQRASALREDICKLPAFGRLSEERRTKIIGGQELYLGGLRSILKLANIDADLFDGIYNYLSAQVHVSPQSFYGTEAKINFDSPATYQLYLSAFAMAHARQIVLRSSVRLASSDETVAREVGAEVIDSMTALAQVPFGE
jgi:hypothetical protein